MSGSSLMIYVRPLSIGALESTQPVNVPHTPGDRALRLIGLLVCDPDRPIDGAERRYNEIRNDDEPTLAPMHDTILRQIIGPLMEAKQCYVLNMPVACIAQAGLVGEMVAIWRFRMLVRAGMAAGESEEEFDRRGQAARVKRLRELEDLGADVVDAFGHLRSIRKQYLHYMVDASVNRDKDAQQAFRLACVLVERTLAAAVVDGKLVFPETVRLFLDEIIRHDPGPATVS